MTSRILFVLLLAIAARVPVLAQTDANDEGVRVQKDVRTLVRALYNGDIDTAVRYTHPRIVALLGGEDATRAAIEGVMLKVKSAGMRVESLTFPRPPEFLEGGGRRFAVVPTLSIVDANGQRLESLNFQFGILEPGASEWRYVEGSRLTKQNVQVLFPGFPATYEFPPFYRKKLP